MPRAQSAFIRRGHLAETGKALSYPVCLAADSQSTPIERSSTWSESCSMVGRKTIGDEDTVLVPFATLTHLLSFNPCGNYYGLQASSMI